MQIENDYDKEVYNGDIGSIQDVDSDAGGARGDLRRPICQIFGELAMLVPAYAAIIHKRLVVLVGQKKAIAIAVRKRLVVFGQKKAVAIVVTGHAGKRAQGRHRAGYPQLALPCAPKRGCRSRQAKQAEVIECFRTAGRDRPRAPGPDCLVDFIG